MEVNKYQQGKIYKLISSQTDKIYIGSTCKKYLSQRLTAHKNSYKLYLKNNTCDYITSFEILKLEDVEIILIETYPCNSKDELTARERHWMEQHKDIIINKVRPIINKEDKKEYYKEYYEDNKEHKKEYYKQYCEANKEQIKEQRKQYREAHKESIKEKKSILKKCELCDCEVRTGDFARHLKSIKHLTKTAFIGVS
jgi:hypothetical protein